MPYRSIFRIIGLLGTALTLGSSGSSTTIVGVSTNNSVYLGADALVGVDGSNAAGRMCKINVGDNAAAAMAGHLGDAATSFDAATVLRRALLEPGDLLAKVRSFVRLVHGPLQQSIDYGRLHTPALFASKYAGKKVLQTIFIAVEGDRPTMIVSTLRAAEDGGLITDEPKQIGPGQVYVFGESAAIARYQRSTSDWNAADPRAIIRTFLTLEIKDVPKLVGPPLSIIQITPDGQQWVDPGQCIPAGEPPD